MPAAPPQPLPCMTAIAMPAASTFRSDPEGVRWNITRNGSRMTICGRHCHPTPGSMVAPGNRKKIYDLTDLTRRDVKFINRASDSGTPLIGRSVE
ncbi:substrate-binding domain-containing protein [Candidatus Aalborgicola defluviihabitans]|uniref:substrate-binding domain-containing protein n=1 Tax=Candidatus Aalborgicola defluviihabitans TaxID=3386187 RepID=UPI001EBF4EF1|nr:hypothetical protein [Burkholderiales bacterium]